MKYVGIDLGTTNSLLAYLRSDGEPEIVPNADGERLTPSVVFFDKHEEVKLVGSSARDGGDPLRTVFQIKRNMDDPNYFVEIDGRKWAPSEISALILSKLKRDCERLIGPIEEVVITVPANFNELARKSTIAAASMAGLKVRRLVNEPTAAALYYAHSRQISGRVMVYDLGGGTLDVTVMEIKGDEYRILLSEGARHLGGANFDEILLDLYADEFRRSVGTDLFTDERGRRRYLQAVEDAKKILSKLQNYTDTLGDERIGLTRVAISRDVFELAISRLLTRTVMLVEQAVGSIGLTVKDIDHVLLVGGSTRIPRVKEMLERIFGKAPLSCGNVDECVALGAALFAKNAAHVHEVCNHGYGTVALIENARTGEQRLCNTIVISKNTPIPCSCTQTYITSEDNEQLIEVEITQGDDEDPKYVDIIGKITLEVPPNRPAGCEVEVTYSYDENQQVKALVLDRQSGRSSEVAINYHGAGVLSNDEIQRRSAYLKQIRIE